MHVALQRAPDFAGLLACAEKRATTSAEGYLNRYRNGWAASAAATKAFVDETVRRRGKPVAGKPAIPLAELPVPMPISRFLWPFVRIASLPPQHCSTFLHCLASTCGVCTFPVLRAAHSLLFLHYAPC